MTAKERAETVDIPEVDVDMHVSRWEVQWPQARANIQAAIEAAILVEREACAKIADGHKIKISDASPSYWNDCGHNEAAVEIADEIRKREQEKANA